MSDGPEKPRASVVAACQARIVKAESLFGSFFQKRTPFFLCVLLTACTQPLDSSDVQKQAAIWRLQAEAQDAANDAALARRHDQLARERAVQAAAAQQQAIRFGQAVAVQQGALAQLRPALQACLDANVRRLAPTPLSASAVANAVLALCRPRIAAIARTVELVQIASDGLAADMSARLITGVRRAVMQLRRQSSVGHRQADWDSGSSGSQTPQ